MTKKFRRKSFRLALCVALVVCAVIGTPLSQCIAQQSSETPPSATSRTDQAAHDAYLFAGLSAFIPLREGYRLNYSTKTLGLPIELMGGLMMPITERLLIPLTIRFVRRTANFVGDMSIQAITLEPGIRYYLEMQRAKDLRLFGQAEILIARASVAGTLDVSTSAGLTGSQVVAKDYYNFGAGFDIGFTYPIAEQSALDMLVHASVFLLSPVSHGGIGNIGGVSLTGSYRFGF